MAIELEDTLVGHLGRLVGKFRLERQLGKGAMGEVYLGVHVELGSSVAVKLMSKEASADPNGVARFLDEARAVAAIDHENVARVIDHDRLPDGTPYIVMEFVDGQTLRDLLQERPVLALRTAVDLMLDTLAALQVAHGKGIVHRDLKPENLRVTPGGRVKVVDFGIAKHLDRPSTALTAKGAIIGTPHYMAPEQVLGQPLDGRADLYAVGVMLFECVTGHRPFEAQTLVDLLKRQVDAAPPWPSRLRADLPASLEQVILKALEKTPERRFESAAQMAQALRATVIELPPVTASVPSPVQVERLDAATPNQHAYVPTTPQPGAAPARDTAPLENETVPMGPARARWPWLAAGLALALFGGLEAARRWTAPAPVLPAVALPAPVPLPPAPEVAPPHEDPPLAASARAQRPAVAHPLPKLTPAKKPAPVLVASAQPPAAVVLDAGQPAPAHPGVTFIETGRDRSTRPIDFDPTHFDPLGFLPEARALARQRMEDAELIDFSVEGVFADGHVDLTLTRDFVADYFFRSPSRSKANPVLPDEAQDLPCLTYVVVSSRNIELSTPTSFRGCHEPFLPKVRCTLPEAARAAVAQGGLTGRVAKASWLMDGWFFDYGDSGPVVSVRCP